MMDSRAPERPWADARAWPAIAAAAAVLVLVFAPPLLPIQYRALLSAGFSFVCHQLPDRTLSLLGVPLAVCSRCVGIYAGLLLGALLYGTETRIARFAEVHAGRAMLLAVSIPGIDWIAGLVGLWDSGHVGRIFTGLFFGAIAGYFLARAVIVLRRAPGERTLANAE